MLEIPDTKIQRNISSLCTAVQAGRRLISSVSCSLSSACLSAGRQEVKVKNGGHLVQRSAHCRFPWSLSVFGGIGLAKAMATLQRWSLTFVCLAPNEDKNWALLVSPLPGASLCFTSRKKWRAFCAAPSIGSFSVPFNSASLFSNSFSEKERSVTTGTEQQLSLRVQQLSLWVQSHMTLLLISAAAPDVFTRNST